MGHTTGMLEELPTRPKTDGSAPSALTRRLGHSVEMTREERAFLEEMQGAPFAVEAGRDFVTEGDPVSASLVMREGWAFRYRIVPSGKRHIVSYVLPGDVIALHASYERHAAHSVAALTDVELSIVEPIRVMNLSRNHPLLASGLDWMTVATFNIVAEHTVSLGVRPAKQRILHLMLELYCRLMVVGLADGDGFACPLTQTQIGDTLGLTSVYVSKCLSRLRADGLLRIGRGRVEFPDMGKALAAADFDAGFLESFCVRTVLPNAERVAP